MSTSLSPWPSACQGAVSLTFDDGLASQLNLAIPMLDKYNLQATFYVNPRDNYQEQLIPWRAAAATGHEVGNHTISHPCSKNFAFISDNGRRGLEEMSLADMEQEIVEAGRRISAVIPAQTAVSYGYTCYQPFVGRGANRQSYVPVVAKHCVAGRGRGERPNDPRYCDLWYLWSTPCERMTGAELVGLAEQAATQGRWTILTFHGINEGHLSVAAGDLEELCSYLAHNRERLWTAPVATIAQRVQHYQEQVA
ncbi:MAG: polysaccharide deacetylase family protein [Caldilineaceae bacterium]|nr:polysaccharide deacetylase family protein [Caldilineaceae bacterium]